MKKIVSVILCAVLALSCTVFVFASDADDSFGEYEHVFIIGIDGAGAMFGREDLNTPNFDRIFADNACRHDAVTEYITTSAQNWGSILTGLSYDVHGFTNDSTASEKNTSASSNHTVFYYVRQAVPDAELVSFCHWSNINKGIIESDIGVKKVNRGTDPLVVDMIVDYFSSGNAPKLMFVQLDSVDHAAHTYGGFSDEYYAAVEKADVYLGDIYDAIYAQGLMDNSLFIVVADHGETAGGHGGQTKEESSAVLAVAGHSVNAAELGEGVHNRDVSAITLHALGIEQPEAFVSSVPADLFGDSREKTTDPNPMPERLREWRIFFYDFVRMVNILLSLFD
ncbi:MAG: alkaline phosphatase [Clostridia bacterium]|nr:alkaline phosphatase [Clostridia bacterium]